MLLENVTKPEATGEMGNQGGEEAGKEEGREIELDNEITKLECEENPAEREGEGNRGRINTKTVKWAMTENQDRRTTN